MWIVWFVLRLKISFHNLNVEEIENEWEKVKGEREKEREGGFVSFISLRFKFVCLSYFSNHSSRIVCRHVVVFVTRC